MMDEMMDKAKATLHDIFGEELPEVETLQGYFDASIRHHYGEIWRRDGLDLKTRSVITISALIAKWRPDELKIHLKGALHLGWTPEELAEVMSHLGCCLGLPAGIASMRVLASICDIKKCENIEELNATSDEEFKQKRYELGVKTVKKIFGDNMPATGVPYVFVKTHFEHVFGEIWARGALSLKTRALIVVAAMVANANPVHLRIHLEGAVNMGCTYEELTEVMLHLSYYVGFPASIEGANVLEEVFA